MGTSVQKCISLPLPFNPYTGEHGGGLNRIASGSIVKVHESANVTNKACFGRIAPAVVSPKKKYRNTTFGGYMAILRERIVHLTLITSSDAPARRDGLG
jgi:hypothetical protein